MMNLLLLVLLAAAGLSLLGAVFFLYRYLVRSRLFPQLPRIWSGDKRRFFLLLGLFVLSLAAFAIVGILTRPAAGPPPQLGYAPPAGTTAPQPVASEEPNRLVAPELPRPDRSAPPPEAPVETPPAPALASAPPSEERALPPQPAPLPEAAPAASPPAEVLPAPPPPPAPAPAPTPTPAKTAQEPAKTAPEPPAPAPKAAPASPAPAAASGKEVFWVCLGSFKEEGAAKASQARLKAQGLETSLWHVDLGAKGRWYRVCAGLFESPAQAAVQARTWKKQGLDPSPFVARKP